MKTFISSIIFLLFFSTAIAGDKYEEAMQQQIEAVYKAQTSAEFLQAINAFERIASAEVDKWEPFYYASFGYVMISLREETPDAKDAYLDKAEATLKMASAIVSEESEIVALQGFIYMMRLTVDPAARGQQYSGLAAQTLGKAIGLNPENPRALGLMSQMQLGSAKFFNSPPDEACKTASDALAKFETFKSDNVLAPRWGKGMTEDVKKQCQ